MPQNIWKSASTFLYAGTDLPFSVVDAEGNIVSMLDNGLNVQAADTPSFPHQYLPDVLQVEKASRCLSSTRSKPLATRSSASMRPAKTASTSGATAR